MDGLEEDSKGLAVARSGGVLSRIPSLSRSITPKLFGILLFAQQFSTASAASICDALSRVDTKLDLIGLISTFGPDAATKSLTYSALNDDWLYLTGHIGPGTLSVAAVLFEATGFSVAHLFAFGGTADAYQLTRLDSPQGLRYIGLKSNTECAVGNAVGACVVREHQALWKEQVKSSLTAKGFEVEIGRPFGRRVGRDAKREVRVITLEVETMQEPRLVKLKASKGSFFLLGWLPLLLTLKLIITCIICGELFVAGLISLGTLGMFVAVWGLRLCRFKFSKPIVAKSAPDGDCLVVDDTDPDTFHIIKGKEEDIQALFQRNIDYQPSLGKYPLCLAGAMLYVYVIASVLYMPNVSFSGQILFAIANLIGFVMDILKASKNGQLGKAKKACEQFNIVPIDVVVFKNRTAAVAFVAKHTKDRAMLKSKKLLPSDGPVWQKWWQELANRDGKVYDANISSDALPEPKDVDLLRTLVGDMVDGLRA